MNCKRILHCIFLVSTAVSVSFCQANNHDEIANYKGYKVYRASSENKNHFIALSQLRESNIVDFWTEPATKGKVDIMASPNHFEEIEHFFSNNGMSYRVLINDVKPLVEAERYAMEEHYVRQDVGMDWESYHSYDEIIAWADSLSSVCPTLISHEDIGNSTENRALRVYKISTGGITTKPAIWVDGTFHAREWISPATVTYFLNDLCRNASNLEFLEHVDFYIMPVVNPDGYEYSRRADRMWRKTRKNHDSPLGCMGVDPNRNFDIHFGGAGTSNDKCSDIYRGPTPWSEPETVAVRDYLLNTTINWQVYITIHSYGQYILIPWSYAEDVFPIDYADMKALADSSANAMMGVHGSNFTVGQSADTLGPTAGCADDWAKANANIKYAYTYELRDEGNFGFLLPPHFILHTAQETMEALKHTARFFIPPRPQTPSP